MLQLVQIVVYWCTLTAPIDSFNPHQLGSFLEVRSGTSSHLPGGAHTAP